MAKSIKCEYGNDTFWYFRDFMRCTKCLSEIIDVPGDELYELEIRNFDIEEQKYGKWRPKIK